MFSFYFKIMSFINHKGKKWHYTLCNIIHLKASHKEESNITKVKISTEISQMKTDGWILSVLFWRKRTLAHDMDLPPWWLLWIFETGSKDMASGSHENYNIVLLLLIHEDHNKLLQDHCHMNSSLNFHPMANKCWQKKWAISILLHRLWLCFSR